MSSPQQSDSSLSPRRTGRKLVRAAIIVVLFFAALIILAPYGAKLYIQKWLLENGAEKAAIGRIGFNPFTGSVSLHDTDVQQGGAVVFADSTVHVDISLGNLFKRTATVQKARLADLVLDVEKGEDGGLRIASVHLPGAEDAAAQEAEQPPAEAAVSEGKNWIVAAEEVDISNVTLRYNQPDLKVQLFIEQGRIRNFTTSPDDEGGTVYIKGTLNESPVEIDLQKCKIVPIMALEGSINVDGFALDHLDALLKPFLDPFDGVVTIDGQAAFNMDEETGIETSYQGHLLIADGKVGGTGWETGATLAYDGDVSYDGGGAGKNTAVSTNGTLSVTELAVNLPETMKFSQKKAVLDGKTGVDIGGLLQVAFDGSLSLEGTDLDMDSMQTALARFSWQGNTGYRLEGESSVVRLKGTLAGEQFSLDMPALKMHVTQKDLKTESDLEVFPAAQLRVAGTASLQGEETLLEMAGEPIVTVASIGLNDIAGTESGGLQAGSFQIRDIKLPVSQSVPVGVSIASVESGKIVSNDLKALNIESIQTGVVQVRDGAGKKVLAAIGKLEVNDLGVDEQTAVTVHSIQVEESIFLQDAQGGADPMATLEKLSAGPVHWSGEDGVACDQIGVHSLYAQFSRTPGEEAEQSAEKSAEQSSDAAVAPEPGETAPEQETEPTRVPVKIGLIRVDGESGFSFTDSTLKIPFATAFQLETAEVKGLDLSNPEQTVEYVLKGNFEEHAPLNIQGTSKPAAEPLLVEQTLTLRNFPLPKVSPYVVQAIGTYFDTGRADLTSTLKLEGDALNLDNNLLLKDLEIRTVNDELAAELNNQIPVPLNLALNMLRDGDGNIDLDIPISGRLSDMNVGISDVIVTAVSKAISVAVVPYMAYTALGPTGALVFMGAKFGGSLLKSDLPALSFEARQLELTDAHKEILDKVGKKLAKKDDEVYSICPRVALAELGQEVTEESQVNLAMQDMEIRKQLREIGQTRASNVQEYLLKNFSIDKDNLLMCDPGIDMEKNGRSVIEFKK